MRAALLEVLPAPYLQLARARGTDEGTIVYRHAFRVALARVIPVIGLQAGFVLGGAAYIEVVFQWPGIGQLLVQAILERDLMLVQGGVVLVALSYVLVNLATDVVQRLVDPRVQA
jgi:peptide/nickel transport system permease protein